MAENTQLNMMNETFKKLSYEEKTILYTKFFSTGTISNGSYEDKRRFVDLLAYLTFRVRQTNDKIKAINVMENILQQKLEPDDIVNSFIIGQCIIVDDLLYGVCNFKQPAGYNTSAEMIAEIKRLLTTWLPF